MIFFISDLQLCNWLGERGLGGGGRGFRPIILETLVLRYELKGKTRTRPVIFRMVLGPCAKFYPCEASEQKRGPNTKILTEKKVIKKKERQNRMKNDRVMPIRRSHKKVAFGLFWA